MNIQLKTLKKMMNKSESYKSLSRTKLKAEIKTSGLDPHAGHGH